MEFKDFPAKTVDEVKVYTFDFSGEIASGATISAPVVEKFTHSGNDPDADGLTLQTPYVDGPYCLVMGADGIQGCTYKLRAKVEDDNGQVHVIWALASVKESAGRATE